MAYELKRGEFESWTEALDLAQRALACDKFVVVSGRSSRNEKKCEKCDSFETSCFTTCVDEERAFCLECLYDVAAARDRLNKNIRDKDAIPDTAENENEEEQLKWFLPPHGFQSQEEAEEEYRRNPMVR